MVDETFDLFDDDYYASLREGDVVHYDTGFGTYVRCVVVDKEYNGTRPSLKPVVLVGEWGHYDLPWRDECGRIHYPNFSKMIRHGEVFAPNPSSIFESPDYVGRSHRRVEESSLNNPLTLPEVSLEVLPMSLEERRKARLWKVCRIINRLSNRRNDPPTEVLRRIRGLLDVVERQVDLDHLIYDGMGENVRPHGGK